MAEKMLTLSASPAEVEKLLDALADNGSGVSTSPLIADKPDHKLRGSVTVDLRGATATYRNGAIEYGPIDVLLKIDEFRVRIDWHKALNIPKHACIHIKDPCGHTIFKECWDWDLGVSEFVLIQNLSIKNRSDLVVLDLRFRDRGGNKEYFELTGDIPLAGALLEIFAEGFVRGAVDQVANLVEKLLQSVLGNGELAKLFIKLIKATFKIIDLALDFVGDTARIALQPLDEWLHAVFGEKLEVVLKKEAFSKKLVLIKKTTARPEVSIDLKVLPTVQVVSTGLTIEIFG